MPIEQDYYFTFGYGHEYGPTKNRPGGYAVFHGTFDSARKQMNATFGDHWAFQYASAKEAGVKGFHLKRIN